MNYEFWHEVLNTDKYGVSESVFEASIYGFCFKLVILCFWLSESRLSSIANSISTLNIDIFICQELIILIFENDSECEV